MLSRFTRLTYRVAWWTAMALFWLFCAAIAVGLIVGLTH